MAAMYLREVTIPDDSLLNHIIGRICHPQMHPKRSVVDNLRRTQFIEASKLDSNPNAAQLTVYFDGACPVCSIEIAHYRRQPGAEACRWIDVAACAEDELGTGLKRDIALRRFHVRRADGQLVVGMRGFAVLWRMLPRTAWLGRVASFGPMPAVLEVGYRVFLAVRGLWRKSPVRFGAAPVS